MSLSANQNTKIAAFFDLDGTLVPEPSLEWRFFSELRRNHAIPLANYLLWSVEALRLLPKGLLAAHYRNKRYLTGLSTDLVFRYFDSICFFDEGIAQASWHVRQGHELVLVSGTLEPLARLAATAMECELEARGLQVQPRVCSTPLAEHHGRWTGYLAGDALYAQAKLRAVTSLAPHQNWNLPDCHAYGNSLLDRHLLCAVGHGQAVNPGKELAALANQRDWPIWYWHQEKKLDSKANVRLTTGIQHFEGQA